MTRLFRGLSFLLVATLGCQQNTGTTQTESSSSPTRTVTDTTPAPSTPAPAAETRTTASGLQIQDLQIGTGAEAATGKRVSVHYRGTLPDGTPFDNSYDRGSPYELTLGANPPEVIKGWEEGIPGMRVGGKRRLIIPPSLAYGARGYAPVIPPNATLHFDLELMDVK